MEKIAIVINGKGASGKDTFCEVVGKYYDVVNRSSITPIKEIATIYGGWCGGKELKDRKFLSDLKDLFSNYNDLPNVYSVNEFKSFMNGEAEVFFIHIREPENIMKFIKSVDGKCVTLLIKGGKSNQERYGNKSDDEVENFDYDFVFYNKPIEDNNLTKDKIDKMIEGEMITFFKEMAKEIEKRELPHIF